MKFLLIYLLNLISIICYSQGKFSCTTHDFTNVVSTNDPHITAGGVDCYYSFYDNNGQQNIYGWNLANGTPQVVYDINNPNNNYAQFFAISTNNCEAIFGDFPIKTNETYTLEVQVRSTQNAGNIIFSAANGLVQHTPNACGDPLQIPSQYADILSVPVNSSNTNFQDVTQSFVIPDATQSGYVKYPQLWVHPVLTSGTQFFGNLYFAKICVDCNGIITYNNGNMPSGTTTAGIINVGNSFGTGGSIVGITSNAATTLNSVQQVDIEPNTIIQPTSTGSFTAMATYCSSIQQKKAKKFSYKSTNATIANIANSFIYPNPTTGLIRLNLKEINNVQAITISDVTGNVVQENKVIPFKNESIQINISSLSAGVYFIRIKTKNKTYTQKVVKD